MWWVILNYNLEWITLISIKCSFFKDTSKDRLTSQGLVGMKIIFETAQWRIEVDRNQTQFGMRNATQYWLNNVHAFMRNVWRITTIFILSHTIIKIMQCRCITHYVHRFRMESTITLWLISIIMNSS